MRNLTPTEKRDIVYFWQYKGDLERLSGFEDLRPMMAIECPHILKAWDDYKTSIKMLDAVINSFDDEIPLDEC